jgi:hypothetical protein
MKISVNYPSEVASGNSIDFEVTVTNTNFTFKEIEYNGAYPADILIFDANGSEVWRHMTGAIILPGGSTQLPPTGSVTFTVEWDGLSHDEITLTPGQYSIRAFTEFRFDETDNRTSHHLSTTPTELQIAAK